jgi:hypothetical protein
MTSLITPAYRLPEGAHVGTVHVFGLAMMANSVHFAPVWCVSGVILRSIYCYPTRLLAEQRAQILRLNFQIRIQSRPPSAGSTTTERGKPPLFTAIQEQLGLKLEPRKAPVEMLVIDHVEQPSPN